jgi:putative hydrolase of HD superfamily
MSTEIDILASAVNFALKFTKIQRHIPRRSRANENDAEHSYMLALVSLIYIIKANLPLDISKILQYALIHDLPETYTGDISAFDTEGRKGKEERELQAITEMAKDEILKVLVTPLMAYENKVDDESIFIDELDKMLPTLVLNHEQIPLNKWQGVTLRQIITWTNSRKFKSPHPNNLREQIIDLEIKNAHLDAPE